MPNPARCISQGQSRAEAVTNFKDAIAGYIESLKQHGDPKGQAMQVQWVVGNLWIREHD